MKRAHVPLKLDGERPGTMLKKLGQFDGQNKQKKRGFKQLRMVQSVTAGHVRGGHSFH